jgi:hypothetical protein
MRSNKKYGWHGGNASSNNAIAASPRKSLLPFQRAPATSVERGCGVRDDPRGKSRSRQPRVPLRAAQARANCLSRSSPKLSAPRSHPPGFHPPITCLTEPESSRPSISSPAPSPQSCSAPEPGWAAGPDRGRRLALDLLFRVPPTGPIGAEGTKQKDLRQASTSKRCGASRGAWICFGP